MNTRNVFFIQCIQLIDAILVFIGLLITFPLRNALVPLMDLISWIQVDARAVRWNDISLTYYGAIPFLPLILDFFGFYDKVGRSTFLVRMWSLFKGLLISFSIFSVLALVFRFDYQNRSIILIASLMISLLVLTRSFIVDVYASRRAGENNKVPILLVGSEASLAEWKKTASSQELSEYFIVGTFDCRDQSCEKLEELLTRHRVEKVIFITKQTPFSDMSKAVEACEQMGIDVFIAADFVNSRIAVPKFDSLFGVPMLVLRSVPELSWATFGKYLMDRVGAFLLIILTLPLWVVAAVGVLYNEGGPIFYRQERAGRFGKPFNMWKFRSMVKNAETKLEKLKLESDNQMSGPVFKLEQDPRVFPFGAWIRKTSIDELPQLINVLMGQMSLVGPRPMACYELPNISKTAHRRKLSVKPGITCIWQVEGRNTITDFEDWVKLDLKYIDEWSLLLDIKILLKTVPAVLLKRGAK